MSARIVISSVYGAVGLDAATGTGVGCGCVGEVLLCSTGSR